MVILLSPAKTLDFTNPSNIQTHTTPVFTDQAQELVNILQRLSEKELQELMHINTDLAKLSFHRFQNWTANPNKTESKQAVATFKGEAYRGLDVSDWTEQDFTFAQEHLRILSGLYGILRPLDLISAYRLEMGTKLQTEKGKNLYDFWGKIISNKIQETINNQGNKTILNLTSAEYYKSVKSKLIDATKITPSFKDFSKGKYRTIVVYTKKARGLMARFVIKNKITDINDVKNFDSEGYCYNERLSKGNDWVFTRE